MFEGKVDVDCDNSSVGSRYKSIWKLAFIEPRHELHSKSLELNL